MRGHLLAVAVLFAGTAAAQVSTPILTVQGPMNCGLRRYQAAQAQTWCIWNAPPAPPVTICNQLTTIFPTPTAGFHSCFATDTTAGNVYEISWAVFPARPPNTTGLVQYQIAFTVQPCTMQSNGVCQQTGPGTTQYQEGLFDSGVASTLVGALWYPHVSKEAPMIQALASDYFAQSGGGSNCRIVSSTLGIADWVQMESGIGITWLPDDWCPNGLGSPPMLYGDCSFEGMTMSAPVFDPDGSPRCSASPVDPVHMLLQARLGSFAESGR